MNAARQHTKDYSQEQRDALGLAVIRARETMDMSQRAFATRAKVGRTSLVRLETADPVGVGAVVYEAVGRFVPGWTEDTPRQILEGGAVPDLAAELPELDTVIADPDVYRAPDPRPAIGTREWLVHYARLLRGADFREVKIVLLRMIEAETRVLELEQELAECRLSPAGVKAAPSAPS